MPVRKSLRQARIRIDEYKQYLSAWRSDGAVREYAASAGYPLPPLAGRLVIGGGDFFQVGEVFVRFFKELCDLKPDEDVLDVGSGYGRVALPLTHYLSGKSRYEGFDVLRGGIRWCEKNVTTRYPNFRFQVSDIYNGLYNPKGRYQAADYRFPYEDSSFDLVFLASVFTHLLPRDQEHYLNEISRVLRPGGRVLVTYFLLNPEVHKRIQAELSLLSFTKQMEGCWVTVRGKEEGAVAFEDSKIRQLHASYGLPIREPIYYGDWSGEPSNFGRQDIVVAIKR